MIYEITSFAFFFFLKETGKIFRDVYVILERAKIEPKFGFFSLAQKDAELLNYEVTSKRCRKNELY